MDFKFLAVFISLILIASPYLRSPSAAAAATSLNGNNGDDNPSAYEVLQTYNFPIGILPKGVTAYTIDTSNGKFSASFNGSCSFSLEGSYQLKYKSTIKGYLTNGRLSSLEGVSVKLFFFWADIVEVYRKGDNLDFSVGIASAGFSVDNFEECPQCGCGLNCHGDKEPVRRKISRNPFVSSY